MEKLTADAFDEGIFQWMDALWLAGKNPYRSLVPHDPATDRF